MSKDKEEGGSYPDAYGIRVILVLAQKGAGSKKAFDLTRNNGKIHVEGISRQDLIDKVAQILSANGINTKT